MKTMIIAGMTKEDCLEWHNKLNSQSYIDYDNPDLFSLSELELNWANRYLREFYGLKLIKTAVHFHVVSIIDKEQAI